MQSLPYVKSPCKDCPFRKDSLKGWLGKDTISDILNSPLFVCHKKTHLQCAGHMHIKQQENQFVQIASRLGLDVTIENTDVLYTSEIDCINHHSRELDE